MVSEIAEQAVSAVLREWFPSRKGPVHLDQCHRLGNRGTRHGDEKIEHNNQGIESKVDESNSSFYRFLGACQS
jgi:hypothetical protein